MAINAQTGEYGDLVKLGIIDPTKVVRTALQDAASIAGLLITTEAMITERRRRNPRRRCRAAAWAAWAAWTTDVLKFAEGHLRGPGVLPQGLLSRGIGTHALTLSFGRYRHDLSR